METHTAFVRADGGAELNAPCTVDLYLVAIVNPYHAKLDHALRFNQTLQ